MSSGSFHRRRHDRDSPPPPRYSHRDDDDYPSNRRPQRPHSRTSQDDEPDLQRTLELRQRQNKRKEEARFSTTSTDLFHDRREGRRNPLHDPSDDYPSTHRRSPSPDRRRDLSMTRNRRASPERSTDDRERSYVDRKGAYTQGPTPSHKKSYASRQDFERQQDHRLHTSSHSRIKSTDQRSASRQSPAYEKRYPETSSSSKDRPASRSSPRDDGRDYRSGYRDHRRESPSPRSRPHSSRQEDDYEDSRRREQDARALDAERAEEKAFRERLRLEKVQKDGRQTDRYEHERYTGSRTPRPSTSDRIDRKDAYDRRGSTGYGREHGHYEHESSTYHDRSYHRNDKFNGRDDRYEKPYHQTWSSRDRPLKSSERYQSDKRQTDWKNRSTVRPAQESRFKPTLSTGTRDRDHGSPPRASRNPSVGLDTDDRKRDHSVGKESPNPAKRARTNASPDSTQTPSSTKVVGSESRRGTEKTSAVSTPGDTLFRSLADGSVYDRLGQVGEGTYGKVYKAQHSETKEFVALKRIRMEQERDGFPITAMREIKLLQRLRAPGVIRLEEMMIERGSVYMVFEYMDHDLTGVLANPAIKLEPAHIKDLTAQLFDGLGYLHQRGVLHRDIKASNILLNNAGQLKLADFGLARFYHKHRSGADYTNRVITLWFRPPELLLGATAYGPSVDIWSAGCIFLELFTGTPTFPGRDEIHQLEIIYGLMGSPTPESWPDVQSLPWFELVKPKATKEGKFHPQFSTILSPHALEFAKTVLQLDPCKRPSASQLMQHAYFSEEPRAERRRLDDILESHEWETKIRRREDRAKKAAATTAAAAAATTAAPGPPALATAPTTRTSSRPGSGSEKSRKKDQSKQQVDLEEEAKNEGVVVDRSVRTDSAELGSP